MTIYNYVTNLDLSKRLKELGVSQESYFWWCNYPIVGFKVVDGDHCIIQYEHYSAFLASELGETLPERFDAYRVNYIKFQKVRCEATQKYLYLCSYVEDGGYNADIFIYDCSDENESNARAKMILFLIENDIVKVKDL